MLTTEFLNGTASIFRKASTFSKGIQSDTNTVAIVTDSRVQICCKKGQTNINDCNPGLTNTRDAVLRFPADVSFPLLTSGDNSNRVQDYTFTYTEDNIGDRGTYTVDEIKPISLPGIGLYCLEVTGFRNDIS